MLTVYFINEILRRLIKLGENDELPELKGKAITGKLELAPGECAFIAV